MYPHRRNTLKKLITAAVLSILCAVSFASDLSVWTGSREQTKAAANENTAALRDTGFATSSQAITVEETQSVRSKVEAGVASLGSVFGSLMRGPALMGKAFVSGFGEGYQAKTAEPAPSVSPSTRAEPQRATDSPALTRLAQLSPTAMLSSLLKRSKDQQMAPIEEKSSMDAAPTN
jgi:hypothetical protein